MKTKLKIYLLVGADETEGVTNCRRGKVIVEKILTNCCVIVAVDVNFSEISH